MGYKTVAEIAKLWGLTERAVRKYCASGKIEGAKLEGERYLIPEGTMIPERKNAKKFSDNNLLNRLKDEKDGKVKGGIYHKVQVNLTYNSNHIEGSKLTEDQTRFIFETNTVGADLSGVPVDDIVEATNHFRCIDLVIDEAKKPLTETLIKKLHSVLKSGTSQARLAWFRVGDYKIKANEVGGESTCPPSEVAERVKELLAEYNAREHKTLADIIDFHQRFEKIHPFQDGNGRVGRLIMFKECLAHNIIPFVIGEEHRWYYYRGLKEWKTEKGYLTDTCLAAQDTFKEWLKYFGIKA
ncbi:MAG: Fic family protein [Clostridiales bacterium]|jgi:Fic family protein|nr:Fic family protein [Clostridiales bacterium]